MKSLSGWRWCQEMGLRAVAVFSMRRSTGCSPATRSTDSTSESQHSGTRTAPPPGYISTLSLDHSSLKIKLCDLIKYWYFLNKSVFILNCNKSRTFRYITFKVWIAEISNIHLESDAFCNVAQKILALVGWFCNSEDYFWWQSANFNENEAFYS